MIFTRNRERLLKHEVGQQLFDEVVGRVHARGLPADEHFTVDGTLIGATASSKSDSLQPPQAEPPRAQTGRDLDGSLIRSLLDLIDPSQR